MSNAIVLENQLQGNAESEWGLLQGASRSIEGFATDISLDVGTTMDFKISTNCLDYRVDIYRLGYYGGLGARLVDSFEHVGNSAIVQPSPLVDQSTGLIDCGNWSVTDSWDIPADAVSGVYIAKLTRLDGITGENHIPFIVRNDASTSDILFQTDDTTWQAYNKWGGANLYDTNFTTAVSYNRPFLNRFGDAAGGVAANPVNFVFGTDYAAIRWLEANGYDVTYSSGVDTARHGSNLLNHDVFLTVGHDEYWSGDQRANVEAARNAGVNMMFWSGNDVFWKTRWEASIDGSGSDYRTMICYKTSDALRSDDPSGIWTGLWRDPDGAASGAVPENALTGTLYMVNLDAADPYEAMTVGSDFAALRFWRNTDVATLADGETLTTPEIIGYEWNVDADNGYRPVGLVHLSSTTAQTAGVVTDANYIQYTLPDPSGYATHNLTLYRAGSGALVFSAGSIAWAWSLDQKHDGTSTPADPNIQQAMVNLFADMGVQPESLQNWLVVATASTDAMLPLVSVSNLQQTVRSDGTVLSTVDGTAFDLGGGVVAGVEVSADNGASWHLASGTHQWSYSWTSASLTPTTFLARAIDDSINVGERTTPFSIDSQFTELSRFSGFYTGDGWNNTEHLRVICDADGDGIKDMVGFGDAGTFVHLGEVDAGTGAISLSADQYDMVADFDVVDGYSAASRRGVEYVGDYISAAGGPATHSPVIWGMSATGIDYYVPTLVDGKVGYSATAQHYDWFSTAQDWSNPGHELSIAFVSTGNADHGTNGDAFASILGFGYAGLTLAPQAFSTGASTDDAYLVKGSESFGFDAGWDETQDIRAVTDFRGNEIDLDGDGILDVVAIGTPGVVYAFGQQTGSGETGRDTYSLGTMHIATIDPSGSSAFNRDWGWNNTDTQRMLADVNGDGHVDIVGFGNAGVYLSLGATPGSDGSGAFSTVYLASAGLGNDDGWNNQADKRTLGDVNGDGLLDVIGFGETGTVVAKGTIDPATGIFLWSHASAVQDYGVAEGWSNDMHLRQVVDIDGNGTDEIVVAGDLALQILEYNG